jgi:hypothetical protein
MPEGSAFAAGGSFFLTRSASASCFFLQASYSGVPGRGGKSFGNPPAH